MINLYTTASTYLFLFLAILFLVTNFKSFSLDTGIYRDKKTVRQQRVIIFLSHLVGYLILFFQTLNEEIAILYIQQVAFIYLFLVLYTKIYKGASNVLLNNILYLQVIGFIFLTRLSLSYGQQQFRLSVFSAMVTLIIPYLMIKTHIIVPKFKWVYAIVGLLLLISPSLIGQEIYGAQNWIIIGGYSFQPSEIAKIAFILYLASLFRNEQSFKFVICSGLVTLLYMGIFIYQNELGIALIFFIIYVVMLYLATSGWYYFLGGLLGASIASWIAYHNFYHFQVRVAAWINPWQDIAGGGYQIAQSLFAIGAGGWLGTGLGKGMPHRIPVVDSDMIFPALMEEWGAIFGIVLILIMVYIFLLGIQIGEKSYSFFYMQVAIGISCAYGFQVFLILGGSTKLIPLTGVTLPFISYGGSSLFASYMMFSILQGILLLNYFKDNATLPKGEDDDQKEKS
ncbi:cell division protein FtsW (lipid II flippase) [Natranaerovirga hydrolytica]|uniref:Cell division protein FtsW (Lipid II flippase) n=1 Tax=Natranaerovirga hydrolytica TaxID=680378 RepID=A0A4R1N012_9FIRM|nr:FtsW/RodA/SpoVE family cell cycle protein [Natranaerovirga hydrolytica]TCK98210.1 cell division protein FtsW (lipid II flippase) [Natranaerovirga hydrolytica]